MRNTLQRSQVVFPVLLKIVAALVLASFIGACSDEGDSRFPSIEATYRFGMRGDPDSAEDFVALTSDVDIIAQARAQLALPDSQRALHINGAIERGNGGHNLSWGWHFIPDAWVLTGSSAEVCDGSPQGVEDDLNYWVDTVQTFCPWSSYVKEEVGLSSKN